jgi:hypothetical protein
MLHVHAWQYLCNQIEQCPRNSAPSLKSPPSNHWHDCSVLPREENHSTVAVPIDLTINLNI